MCKGAAHKQYTSARTQAETCLHDKRARGAQPDEHSNSEDRFAVNGRRWMPVRSADRALAQPSELGS